LVPKYGNFDGFFIELALPHESRSSTVTELNGAVFLSYASEDTAAAQRICAALRAAGVEVWFDQSELRGGDAWDAAIRTQIKSCALFVPLVSSHTRARTEGYFRLEWKLAVDRSHLMAAERPFLVPVIIDDTPEADARVPDKFREIQWIRLANGVTTSEFVTRMRRLLSQVASGSGASPAVHAAPGNRTPPTRGLSLPLLISSVLLIAAVTYIAISRRSTPTTSAVASRPTVAGTANSQPILDQSIAVLPFTDLSEKKDQQYFSDGLSEELIDLLTQIPELKVAARTSSFSFRDRPATVAEIARALGVANVLEGSVRKSGNTIRITAQLVRADNGFSLWSSTYDRDLRDVFQVQDDIARVVVDKLKVTLASSIPSPTARTENTEAHNLLLQGNFALQSDTDAGTAMALKLFRQAIAADADYAPAWNGAGYAEFRRGSNGYERSIDAFQNAEHSARRAIELDPALADAYALLAGIQTLRFDWKDADESRAKALQLNPGNGNALLNQAVQTLITGSQAEAIAQMQVALDRDPLNMLNRRYAGRMFFYAGRLAEAERLLRQILAVNPNYSAAHYELGRVLLIRGNAQAALAEFEAETNPDWRAFGLPLGYYSVNRKADADAALNKLLARAEDSEFQIAEAYAWFGNADKAFEFLNKAVSSDPGIIWIRHDPLLKGLEGDPRYQAILTRINLPSSP
jgi:TolB-like protein/Tfp pilus assembly protein PilF